MAREQKGRGEAEEKGDRRRNTGSKTKPATTISVAQEATIGPAPMEGVERTNAVVVRGIGQGQSTGAPPRRDPFAMEVDSGRNCFACGEFGHMARHCRNRGMRGRVGENRRIEYGEGQIEEIMNFSNNLKVGEDLELLN